MLDEALKVMTDRLNAYMHKRFDLDEDAAVLAAPFDSQGNAVSEVNNKLVVFLANINKDNSTNNGARFSSGLSSTLQAKGPLYLNLYVVVGALFDAQRYQDSLRFLSCALSCFQVSSVMDSASEPDLPDGIDRLIVDIENTSIQESANLWGILGGKYMPSILYKVRMVVVDDGAISGRSFIAEATENSMGGD